RTLWRVRKVDPNSEVLICDDFEQAADRFSDRIAVVFEGRSFTYRQLDEISNRFAVWADRLGLQRGETVALLLPNRAEYIPAWMGMAKLGIATALINNNLTGAALTHSLSISGADHVITDPESLAAVDTIRAGLA